VGARNCRQAALEFRAAYVIANLLLAGLPDINDREPLQMIRCDQ
jgi:hypothetical protein